MGNVDIRFRRWIDTEMVCWLSPDDGLPEDNKTVLATVELDGTRTVIPCHTENGVWSVSGRVVAWALLPDPCKGE